MHAELTRLGCLGGATRFITVHFSHSGLLLHEDLESRLAPLGIDVGYDGLAVDLS
jgi:hypothetical protein